MAEEQNGPFKRWMLHTFDGHPVVEVDLPMYMRAPGPQLVIWGERFFVYDADHSQYREAMGMFAIVPGNEKVTDQMPKEDDQRRTSPDGFDYGQKMSDGQYENHPTIETEGKKFIRPIRRNYYHKKCGKTTVMPGKIAETIAAKPDFYGKMFCAACGKYIDTGSDSELFWLDENDKPTDQRVGT